MKLSKATSISAVMCFLTVVMLFDASALGQRKVFTVAGGAVHDGGPATAAALNYAEYGAYDQQRNLYIADHFAHRIRRVDTSGVITTVAGNGISGYSGDGGPAKSAKVSFPTGLLVDKDGNIIFSDNGNNRIRKIDSGGVVTTIAGNGTAGYSGDGGPATAAELNSPWGLALVRNRLYIADSRNNVVRTINGSGVIQTVAGNGTAGYSGDGGAATAASLNLPLAEIVDGRGNLYIADDLNSRVRKVDAGGTITTFAGNGSFGCTGDGGLATSATVGSPAGLMITEGSLRIATSSCGRMRSVDLKTNIIGTAAGLNSGFNGDGNPALSTDFQRPHGLGLDPSHQVTFLFDSANNRVRGINKSTQKVFTIAGGYLGDGGPSTDSSLDEPYGINFDGAGNLYIAELLGNRIRKVDTSGTINTFAGTGFSGYSGDGGSAKAATLSQPQAAAADLGGNVFLADQFGFALRKVDANGTIATLANPEPFTYIFSSLATDASGNLYAADLANCVIWKITAAAVATIVGGVQGQCGYNGDGIPATQALMQPSGVAVDSRGILYIADTYNDRVRRVGRDGKISTVAGNGTCGFSGDGGPAVQAMVCSPQGVVLDSNGILYIADSGNSRVRVVNRSGVINTFAGTGSFAGYNGNGLPAGKTNFDFLNGIATSPDDIVYVTDIIQSRVRKIQ